MVGLSCGVRLYLTVSRALGGWLDFLSSKAARLFFSFETIAQFDQLPTPIRITDGDSPSILLISKRDHFHVENLDWHDRTPRVVRVDPACTRLSGISSRRKSMAPLSCSLLGVRYGSCLYQSNVGETLMDCRYEAGACLGRV